MRGLRWLGSVVNDWATIPRQLKSLAWGVLGLCGVLLVFRILSQFQKGK
ncbi:MAG: hypothetical protein L0211_02215 [Planctomycetaceae bacterium]|nr:hypothetical protein [Planctomycetaceae bacterium]